MKTQIMDSSDRQPEAKTKHSQNKMSPPLEHDDAYPIHPDGQLPEQWMVSVPSGPADLCSFVDDSRPILYFPKNPIQRSSMSLLNHRSKS